MTTASKPKPAPYSKRASAAPNLRVFDGQGNCTVPLTVVKDIMGIRIDYDEETITVSAGSRTRTFERDDHPNAWHCLRAMRLLGKRFEKKAEARIEDLGRRGRSSWT